MLQEDDASTSSNQAAIFLCLALHAKNDTTNPFGYKFGESTENNKALIFFSGKATFKLLTVPFKPLTIPENTITYLSSGLGTGYSQAVCVTTHKGSWVKLLLRLISIVTRSSSHLVREMNQTQGSKHCCLFRKTLRKREISRIFKIL